MSATIQPAETRRLATILSIDIAGFSRASEVDDVAAARHVRSLRALSESCAAEHGGRIFNTAGDGLMLEFPTVASGVAATLDIADAARADTTLPRIRMGLHVGDVTVLANGDLIGTGVNVAARVQQRAAPGEILTTSEVRNLAGGQLAASFTDYGSAPLDKMSRQVALFALARDGVVVRQSIWSRLRNHQRLYRTVGTAAIAALATAAYVYLPQQHQAPAPPPAAEAPRPTIPVVAVLPFANLSGDPKLQYFSDGMTEEVQDTLSRIQGIRVISRTSAFAASSGGQDTRTIARSLNATHVLTGSVRANGQTMRVSAQLLLGDTGAIVWSDSFERSASETLAVQDEIAARVARALKVVAPQTQRTPSIDPKAVEFYLRGREEWRTGGDMGLPPDAALISLREAVRLAPDFARAWAALASAYAQRQNWFVGAEQEAAIKAAIEAANKAIELDPGLGEPYIVLGRFDPSPDLSAREPFFAKAIEVEPNDDDVQMLYAMFWLSETGRFAEARRMLEQVYAVDPFSDLLVGRYAETLAEVGDAGALEKLMQPLPGRSEKMDYLWQSVLVTKLMLGDVAGAKAAAAKLEDAFNRLGTTFGEDIGHIRDMLKDVLAVRENGDAAAKARVVAEIARLRTVDQSGAQQAIFDALLIGDTDTALDVAHALFVERSVHGTKVDMHNFPAEYPYGRAPADDLMSLFGKDAQKDPRVWDIFAATGHAQYWLKSGNWPDFCARGDLGYDCKTAAEKAIAAQKVN